jgi:hypothetical protein
MYVMFCVLFSTMKCSAGFQFGTIVRKPFITFLHPVLIDRTHSCNILKSIIQKAIFICVTTKKLFNYNKLTTT